MIRLAVFQSHPTQNFAPLWQEIAKSPDVALSVFYYSRANVMPRFEPNYGQTMTYDIDLLSGYEHRFLSRRWPWRDPTLVSGWALNAGVTQAVAAQPWDAAIVFGYSHLNNWTAVRECQRRGVPVLYFSDSNIRTVSRRTGWKAAAKRFVLNRFFSQIDCCLSPSTSNAEYLRAFGAAPGRIRRFPFPVDIERLRKSAASMSQQERSELMQRYRLTPDDFVVAYLGKLYDGKRPRDLAEAVVATNDHSIKALFIGSGAAERELASYGDRVRMAGFVNQREIAKVLSLAHVSVMPSAIDAFGLNVTESLALGIPVLVSDRCGCHGPDDLLQHSQNGFVYACGNVSVLTARITELKQNAPLRGELSQRATSMVESQSLQAAKSALLHRIAQLRSQPRDDHPPDDRQDGVENQPLHEIRQAA